MQNPSYNVYDCPLFCHLVLSLFLRLFIVILFSYCHQLLSYIFSLNNSSVQQKTRMINVSWDAACYTRPLYSYLVVLPDLPLLGFFSIFASSGLFLCICLCQAFSVFCLLWALCSVGWQCSLVVWPLGPSWMLCKLGNMGMPVPEARVCWVCSAWS